MSQSSSISDILDACYVEALAQSCKPIPPSHFLRGGRGGKGGGM